jgi:hypothetical protein
MHIEERLESIDLTLKALLVAMQSGAQMSAATGAVTTVTETEAETKRKRRTKAEIAADEAAEAAAKQQTAAVLPGDPAGTRYWVSETLRAVFVEQPGVGAPADATFKIESPEHFAAKKAEFAAGNVVSTPAASSAPVAAQAAAPAASTAGSTGEVTWDQAVAALKGLAQNPSFGGEYVVKVIKSIDPTAANVPALKDKGHNAAIVAAVNAVMNPVAETAAADPLFG